MFEGIPKELPQTSHKAQDFFIFSLLISQTVSIKIIVLYEKKTKMKKIQFSHACRALRRPLCQHSSVLRSNVHFRLNVTICREKYGYAVLNSHFFHSRFTSCQP
ncbi:TPA: hypothetical protein MI985_20500 [Klebsiella pneumoniae]|nr:hypothetical protein [Klebsiella pneumoniae]